MTPHFEIEIEEAPPPPPPPEENDNDDSSSAAGAARKKAKKTGSSSDTQDKNSDQSVAKDITEHIKSRLIYLTVQNNVRDRSNTFSMELNDSGNRLKMPPREVLVTVSMGYIEDGSLTNMGTFTADQMGIKGPPDTMFLSGASERYVSMGQSDCHTYKGPTLLAVVQKVAEYTGMQAVVAKSLQDFRVGPITQLNETYSFFMTRLARLVGGFYNSNGMSICILEHDAGATADGKPLPPIRLSLSQLTSWNLIIADQNDYDHVGAWWRDGNNPNYFMVYYPPLTEEKRKVVSKSGKRIYMISGYKGNANAAQGRAKTAYENLKHQVQQLSITCPGNPLLRAGVPVFFDNGRSELRLTDMEESKQWIVNEATHILSNQGYRTECKLWPSSLPPDKGNS